MKISIKCNIIPDDNNYYHDSCINGDNIEIDMNNNIHTQIMEYIENTDYIEFCKKGHSNMYCDKKDGKAGLSGFVYRYKTEYEKERRGKQVLKYGYCWVIINIPNMDTEKELEKIQFEF